MSLLIFLKRLVNTNSTDVHTIGRLYGVKGKRLQRQYKATQVIDCFHVQKLAVEARIGLKNFATIMNTVKINYDGIVNYFENRSTNAATDREAAPQVII